MASKPYPDHKRGIWRMKWRPAPFGPWVAVTLAKDPRLLSSRPPKTPPQNVIDRSREFEEAEYRAKHRLGPPPAQAKPLGPYLDAYVESYGKKRGSVKQLVRHVASFTEFCAARKIATVQGVSRSVCRDYLTMRAKTVSASTLRTERGYLGGIWTRAVEDELITANPWARLKIPGRVTETDITFWSTEEIGRIAAAAAKGKPWHRDLILFLANTGIRISTALAMEWDWIDWDAGTVRIPIGEEEVKTPYVHSLNGTAREILQRRLSAAKGTSPLVFPNPMPGRGRIPYDTGRDVIDKAIRKAKVKPGTPHDLRHSYGRTLGLAGVPASVIQQQLGHASLAMTQRYISTDATHANQFTENINIGV